MKQIGLTNQINFCKLPKEIKRRFSSFLSIFRGNILLYAVRFSLGCLSELSNDSKQPSTTSYVLLHHGCFNILTNIGLTAFTLTWRHAHV